MASMLEQEIASQPEVIARLIEREMPRVRALVTDFPSFSYALIAARGTSDHAGPTPNMSGRLSRGIPSRSPRHHYIRYMMLRRVWTGHW